MHILHKSRAEIFAAFSIKYLPNLTLDGENVAIVFTELSLSFC
jgi:hypothetical protein